MKIPDNAFCRFPRARARWRPICSEEDRERSEEAHRIYIRDRHRQFIKRAYNVYSQIYKDGLQCIRCGMNDSRCFSFHHRDPSSKVFNIGRVYAHVSLDTLTNEIRKCDVLCMNCHAIVEWEKRTNFWDNVDEDLQVRGLI